MDENQISQDDLWLNKDQIRLITHKLYSSQIYNEIILPFLNENNYRTQIINDIVNYLDSQIEYDCEQFLNLNDLKTKLL